MKVTKCGATPSMKGTPDYFTGTVRRDPLFDMPEPARTAAAYVSFEPGARTKWHTHPLGQALVVTFGCGWVGKVDGTVYEIKPGDVVWIEPGEKHWHGGTRTTAMTHMAIQEGLDGKMATWLEPVSEDDYKGP